MKKITDSERNARVQISTMLRAARAGFREDPQDHSRAVTFWESYAAGVRTRLIVQLGGDDGPRAELTMAGARHLLRRLGRVVKRLEARKPKRTTENYPWCPKCGADEPKGEVCPNCGTASQTTNQVVDKLLSVAIDRARCAIGAGWTPEEIAEELKPWPKDSEVLAGIKRTVAALDNAAAHPDPGLPSLDGPRLRAKVRLVGGTPKRFAARLVKWNGAPIDEPGRCDGIVDGVRCGRPLGHLGGKCGPKREGE